MPFSFSWVLHLIFLFFNNKRKQQTIVYYLQLISPTTGCIGFQCACGKEVDYVEKEVVDRISRLDFFLICRTASSFIFYQMELYLIAHTFIIFIVVDS